MYADVLVSINTKQNDKRFTYESNFSNLLVGMRVIVPFGSRKLEGFVLKVHNNKPDFEVKKIISLVDDKPVLTEELLRVGYYISKKTLSPLITSYQSMLPRALKANIDTSISKKYETYLSLNSSEYTLNSKKQEEVVDALKKEDKLKSEMNEVSSSSVKTLLDKGIINEYKKEIYRTTDEDYGDFCDVQLTDSQSFVVDKILKSINDYKTFLLHGVTGSGKTEVYMNVIEKVIANNKDVIMLVPEISLTPQIVCLFKQRFKNNIAILHSGLSDGEKYDEWRKIERKEVKIVVGARSAIFAPFENLGVIIIDEEHSSTYKQESTPRYHTIDVANFRAKENNIPLILGSATPSVESYTWAKTGKFELLELNSRVKNVMPEIEIVDMKDELKNNYKILSKSLKEKIEKRLENNEQVIILLNRRGYSTTSICSSCYETLKCPRCDIPLTYHKENNHHLCHYCGHKEYSDVTCKSCGSKVLNNYGIGTQKLEEHLLETFKDSRVARLDQDTTRAKNSLESILRDFKNNKYDILIGTQMISKGLDFNDVTLVGVLNADATLNIPDFRSGERTYQLLSQVSGRSGRDTKKGEVVIQTFNEDHYSIKFAKKHDYIGFYNYEMKFRKAMSYPPYFNICIIKGSSKDYNMLFKEMTKVKSYMINEKIIVLGPANSNIAKIKNMHNVQVMIKYKKLDDIKEKLEFIKNKYEASSKLKIMIDVNAISM